MSHPGSQCRPLSLSCLLPLGCPSPYIDPGRSSNARQPLSRPCSPSRSNPKCGTCRHIPATRPSAVEPQRRSERWHSLTWSPWAMWHHTTSVGTTGCPILECHLGVRELACRHVQCQSWRGWLLAPSCMPVSMVSYMTVPSMVWMQELMEMPSNGAERS